MLKPRTVHSDLISEAGALSLYDPTGETQGFSMENATPTQQAPDVFEQSTFSNPTEDVSWTNDTWDLYRLYLAEMGHRDTQPTMSNTAQAAPQGATQLGQPSTLNDLYTFWSDASTAYNW